MIIINRPWGHCSQNLLWGGFWHYLNGWFCSTLLNGPCETFRLASSLGDGKRLGKVSYLVAKQYVEDF